MRRLLGAAAVVLLVVGILEVWYLVRGPAEPPDRPVVVGDLAARAAVDEAAQDLTEIASTSYRNYDDQVEQATSMMTPAYAEQYRVTARSLRPAFEQGEREVAAEVVASAVVSATQTRVQALVFLDSRVSEHGKPPVVLPYRTLVTMTRSGHGWLVSGIETR